jgi:c-di-GMP-binding flagellar brake protein YcgR
MAGPKNKGEQRQVARRHLVFYLRIFDGMSSRVLGHLMDISPNGLMLLSDEPVAENEEYRLRMRLPKEVAEREEIVFEAVSRWCRQDENPDFYVVGFQIQDMDSETKKSVSQLIEEFGFSDQG